MSESTIADRVKQIRTSAGLTQQQFAERVQLKRNTITLIESGRATSEQTIHAISREFHVDEVWLRTGVGEPYRRMSRKEEIAAFMGDALSGPADFREVVLSAMARFGEAEWAALAHMTRIVLEEQQRLEREQAAQEPEPPSES